jgi:Reverse transcriptase (RNA-dependent DNA polymerase)
VPPVKDKLNDLSTCSNYRAITFVAAKSKLFEKVMLYTSQEYLNTDERQFCFKNHLGRNQAIFTVRSTVDFFTNRGSSVYAATLDINKVYDKIHHYKLYTALVHAGVPMWVTHMLADRYSKLFVAVRWNDSVASYFRVDSGVRQGSTLSPALFNIFVNRLIVDLKIKSGLRPQ